MITARDAAKRIDVYDPLIDKFIEEVLIPTFANTGKKAIHISSERMDRFYQDNGSYASYKKIISQFKKRGFSIKYKCDDRPCGSCLYTIEIPPKVE
jgi:aminopeptidase N